MPPSLIKVKNEKVWNLFSNMYHDTNDEDSYTPDTILKVGAHKKEFYCHRLMLITASDFLREILTPIAPETTPVILLPDISPSVFIFVKRFIYHGEIHVPENGYEDFLAACKMLQLKFFVNEPITESIKIENEEESDDTGSKNTEKCENSKKNEFVGIEKLSENFISETIDDLLKKIHEENGIIQINSTESEDLLVETDGDHEMLDNLSLVNHPSDNPPAPSETSNDEYYEFCDDDIDSIILKDEVKTTLTQYIRKIYKRLEVPITAQIKQKIDKSKLDFEKNKLKRGIHECGLCDQIFSFKCITSNGNLTFQNFHFRKHILKQHGEVLKKTNIQTPVEAFSVPGENENE